MALSLDMYVSCIKICGEPIVPPFVSNFQNYLTELNRF